jgi:hypothetical protein
MNSSEIANGDPSVCSGRGYQCLVPLNFCNCYDGYTGRILSTRILSAESKTSQS